MADIGLTQGNAIVSAYDITSHADQTIEYLLEALAYCLDPQNHEYNSEWENFGIGVRDVGDHKELLLPGREDTIDPQGGAGTLIIDRLMSELSNLESIAANSIATLQRMSKETNSKLT